MLDTQLRTTIGIIDQIEPNGYVFVHEVNSNKLGFLADTTPVEGRVRLRRGLRLSLDVMDKGNVMVVSVARPVSPPTPRRWWHSMLG